MQSFPSKLRKKIDQKSFFLISGKRGIYVNEFDCLQGCCCECRIHARDNVIIIMNVETYFYILDLLLYIRFTLVKDFDYIRHMTFSYESPFLNFFIMFNKIVQQILYIGLADKMT